MSTNSDNTNKQLLGGVLAGAIGFALVSRVFPKLCGSSSMSGGALHSVPQRSCPLAEAGARGDVGAGVAQRSLDKHHRDLHNLHHVMGGADGPGGLHAGLNGTDDPHNNVMYNTLTTMPMRQGAPSGLTSHAPGSGARPHVLGPRAPNGRPASYSNIVDDENLDALFPDLKLADSEEDCGPVFSAAQHQEANLMSAFTGFMAPVNERDGSSRLGLVTDPSLYEVFRGDQHKRVAGAQESDILFGDSEQRYL